MKKTNRIIHDGFKKAYSDDFGNEIFTKEGTRFLAKGFRGKAINPTFYYSFSSKEKMDAYVAKTAESWKAAAEEKQKAAQAKKEKRASFQNKYKVGDILYRSWGYDQTNVDYYQVVEVLRRSVKIQEIRYAMDEERSKGCFDSGYCYPIPGSFIPKSVPTLKMVDVRTGTVCGLRDTTPTERHYVSWYA